MRDFCRRDETSASRPAQMGMLATTSENLASAERLQGGDGTEIVLDNNAIVRLFAAPQENTERHGQKRREYKRRATATAELNAAARRRVSPARRCNCGECYTCRENARWEQIFQEKFADPTYYQRGLVCFQSPLHVR